MLISSHKGTKLLAQNTKPSLISAQKEVETLFRPTTSISNNLYFILLINWCYAEIPPYWKS